MHASGLRIQVTSLVRILCKVRVYGHRVRHKQFLFCFKDKHALVFVHGIYGIQTESFFLLLIYIFTYYILISYLFTYFCLFLGS